MGSFRLLLASAMLLGAANSQAAVILQTDTYNGHTYKLIADDNHSRISWFDAEAAAISMGGHLVTINDAAENNFVLSTFSATAASTTPADGGTLSLWLGNSDAAQEGNWVWADGTTSSYSNWHIGEPKSEYDDEDFGGMTVYDWLPGTAGQWHDIIGDWRFNDVTFGVVELNTSVPAPTTISLFFAGLLALTAVRLRKFKRS